MPTRWIAAEPNDDLGGGRIDEHLESKSREFMSPTLSQSQCGWDQDTTEFSGEVVVNSFERDGGLTRLWAPNPSA